MIRLGRHLLLSARQLLTIMHRDNHYVPRSYLKQWASPDLQVWRYRLLVSHARVPLWKLVSTRGVAYHEHLYTKVAASEESDEIERWLDSEFEAPVEQVIERAVSERRLNPSDWRLLARFFAAQDVRTPARLLENVSRWQESVPEIIQSTLKESVARLEAMTRSDRALLPKRGSPRNDIPFRVTVTQREGELDGWIEAETVAGRGLWLWSIQQILTDSSQAFQALQRHRWTILRPPAGESWFTSDDPVLKVNFNSLTDYTFGGGWGSIGTDLMLPLGPEHLLYTQVGRPVPPRGTRMDREKAAITRRLIAEHAHRYVFANAPDSIVEKLCPRVVDAAELKREAMEWKRWHAEQSAAERSLI